MLLLLFQNAKSENGSAPTSSLASPKSLPDLDQEGADSHPAKQMAISK